MSVDLDSLRGRLIVSCQAYPGEPMRDPRTMAQIAAAVERGGAAAVRAQGLDDIPQVRAQVQVPVIGIWKDGAEGVFITPTLAHARAVAAAGADIVALDATRRPRPDGLTLEETVAALRSGEAVGAETATGEPFAGTLMADCDDVDAALAAADAGIELIGTTLAGYTGAREKTSGPDLALLESLAGRLPSEALLIAEGRVHSPADARRCLEAGADAVVVGTAITHPTTITTWFADAVASTTTAHR